MWSDFGDRGKDIVVANIDTGVDHDHPALVGRYRGNNGDGSFDHNHNWFDPTQVCNAAPVEPCDNIGHGTHTMGTMVGEGGPGNQIGVAPEATWIAAKGCADEDRGCPQDTLLASAQWVLAPTDLDGADPRPDLRPNIVNNSWGEANGPAEDPWFDSVLAAWRAAGMFAVFSNGNFGPGCDSAASPADSALAYGVGAYDVNNTIAEFSSRGPGAAGDIRPAISAPGVAVRSSLPGGADGAMSGTSMAAPAVSGVVALLWSAAPALRGDIDATREILDDSAVDVDDLTCGGTPEDNNVWGEGRLDAYAALESAPIGATGVLAGVVTDADTGEPIADAKVSAVSDGYQRRTTTAADGSYDLTLLPGDYDVSIQAFGYVDHSSSDITIAADGTVTDDIELEPGSMTTVSGTVTDDSGHGWPLYATVTVDGTPLAPVYTDPETGQYSVDLPSGHTYDVYVRALSPGYQAQGLDVTPSGRVMTQDVGLAVSTEGCLAPGYQSTESGLFETFDDAALPDGWSMTWDVEGQGDGWEFTDPGQRGNLTGGEDRFASIDGASGSRLEAASLVSPATDLSEEDQPVVAFRNDYLRTTTGTTVADVDLSVDGGSTWENLWQQGKSHRGPELVTIPVPQAAGQPNVQVRFHYHQGWVSEGFWEVDDVLLGRRACEPIEGGMVVGTVTEDLGGKPVVGADVSSSEAPQVSAVTVATDDDPGLADGFYSFFTPATGEQQVLVRDDIDQYGARSHDIDVVADDTLRADLTLGVGRLTVSAKSVDTTVAVGKSRTVTLTVKNAGTAPASYDIGERPTASGAALRARSTSPTSAAEARPTIDTGGPFTSEDASPARQAPPGRSSGAWQVLPNMDDGSSAGLAVVGDGRLYYIGGEHVNGGSGQEQRAYDIATKEWSNIAPTEDTFSKAAGGFINHKMYVVGGWETFGSESTATRIYDPRTDSWSRGADAPVRVAAAGYATTGGKLYVIGGRAYGSPGVGSTTVAVYKTHVRTAGQRPPTTRHRWPGRRAARSTG